MTPSQAAQEKPTSPRTADQRTSIYRMREWLSTFGPDAVIYDGTWRVGRPIDLFERALTEREAAAATPSLTDGLLGDILDLFLPFLDEPHDYRARQDRLDERLRKAHVLERMIRARLDEGSATPREDDDD